MIFQALPLATDTTSSAYQAGQVGGMLLVLTLLLVGAGKCISLMRRPHTSTICVLALFLVLINGTVGVLWNHAVESAWVSVVFAWAILLVKVPLLLAVMVLAIVGLALYDSTRFIQGRAQAVWAMILSVVMMGLIGQAYLSGPLEDLARQVAEGAQAGAAGQASLKEEWNFSLTPPDQTWLPQPPAVWSPLACTSYLKRGGQVYAIVIAEHSPALQDNGLDTMVGNVKTNLTSKSQVRKQSETRQSLAGLEFARISTIAWANSVNKEIAYEHWVATHRGFAWQIMVWGDFHEAALVESEGRALMTGFRVLDLNRTAPGTDIKVDVNRPGHGYQTEIAALGWQTWQEGEKKDNPLPLLADFGAQTLASVVLVMPYHHTLAGAPPSAEALAKACLAEYEFTYDRDSGDFTTRSLKAPFPGLEITTERESSDGHHYHYLFRVYQSGKHAWMLAGWTRKTASSTLNGVRAALDQIHLTAPTGEPPPVRETAARTKSMAQFMNQVGLWYHARDEVPQALQFFREASRLLPEDRTYFENITHALESESKFEEALTLMDSARERPFSKDHGHLMRHAWLTLKTGKTAPACQQVLALIKDGYKQHDSMLGFINELLKSELHAEAREVTDAYAAAHPEPRPRLWQGQVAERGEAPDRAITLFESLIKDEPEYAEATYALGELSNRHGDYDRALELAAVLEKDRQDTVRLHLMRGWAHMGRKWYRDAKTSFEKAAKMAPEDEDVKSALKDASASLGQGSNTEIKTPIEPVPLPQSVASRLEALRDLPENYGNGHNAAMLLWSRCIQYTPDKPMRTTTRRLIHILNDEGADAFSSIEYTYDPLIERLHVNRAEVMDASGKVVARAGIDDAYILDSDDSSMATTERTVHIQVPGLKTGHTLDCEITVERLFPKKTFPLMRQLFASGIPTRLEVMSISGDTESVTSDLVMPDRIKVTRAPGLTTFEVNDTALTSDESYQQPIESWAPVLVLSGKSKTWEEEGLEYLKNIEERLKPDPAIEAEAKQLTEGMSDMRQKVRALASFVQKSVRYKAIEFGVRGQMPNAPGLTLQQRYGDCKDQALLLHHLLRACDIPSNLALVNTLWELELKQPTLDAFNHAIVHVPGLKDTLFIDTTASYLSVADHSPFGLWGLSAFVLDPQGPVIMKIPGPLKGSGDVISKRRLSLLPPDGIRVVEELTMRGYYASGIRSGFARKEPKARFQHAQDLLDDMGSYRLEDFSFENLADLSQPAVLRLTYSLPNAIEKRGDVTKLRLPSAWETDYLRISFIKERQTPFRWTMPFRLQSEVTWDASLPIDPASIAAMARKSESRFGRWEMKTDAGLQFEFSIQNGDHAAADYAEFQALWSSAHDLWLKEPTLKVP